MKKILLPTDFSDNSWNAIQYALHLFKNDDCEFFLLNTYTPMIYNVEYMEVGSAQFGILEAMKTASENKLASLLEKMTQSFSNSKHTFTKVSSFNTLTNEIEELQEKHGIDYVIMGTQGATGLKEVLFGSNTVHVIKSMKCPVLAIPNNFSFETLHDVLFPTDYEVSFTKKHVASIKGMLSSKKSRIHFLHITYNQALTEKKEDNKQTLEAYFKNYTFLFHNMNNQNVPEAITKFQVKTPINMLVMVKNNHTFLEKLFFKSVINTIGFHIKVPFLVIPE